MIVNFVDDTFLGTIYPDISNHLRTGDTDYSSQIATAHAMFIDDLENRDLDSRLCMVPLDLNRTSTSTNLQHLESETMTAAGYGEAVVGNRERRFVVNITAKTASNAWTFILEGSNDSEEPADDDSTWTTVTTLTSAVGDTTGQKTIKFSAKYYWYRLRVTLDTSAGAHSITFTACIYETIYDYAIAYIAFKLIFGSWIKENGDIWTARKEQAESDYSKLMETIKINYDRDEDGIPEDVERYRKIGGNVGSVSISA